MKEDFKTFDITHKEFKQILKVLNKNLPNLTALNSLLVNVKVGDKIKVVYLGSEKSKKTGRIYENFKVYIKKNH